MSDHGLCKLLFCMADRQACADKIIQSASALPGSDHRPAVLEGFDGFYLQSCPHANRVNGKRTMYIKIFRIFYPPQHFIQPTLRKCVADSPRNNAGRFGICSFDCRQHFIRKPEKAVSAERIVGSYKPELMPVRGINRGTGWFRKMLHLRHLYLL